jgi:hypothetical protein
MNTRLTQRSAGGQLKVNTADSRTTWIVVQVLLAVLVLFAAVFGLIAYHDTGDVEEAPYNALGAALVALPPIAIGILVVASSLRPFIFSATGITRWPHTMFSWGEIESYEIVGSDRPFLGYTMDRRSGWRFVLHTATDAFPVDLASAGFLLSEKDRPRVEAFMARMGVPRRSTAPSSRGATDSSIAIREKLPDRSLLRTSTRDGSRILLHLGKEKHRYRRVLVDFLLTAVVGVPVCWGCAERLTVAGVPESLLLAIVLLLLVGSMVAIILLQWTPQQAFLTEKGISKFLWLSREWNEIEYYEVSLGPSPRISGDALQWPRLRIYSKRSGFPRTVYYWTGRMPKADRLRIEQIMAERGIPAYPYPGPL